MENISKGNTIMTFNTTPLAGDRVLVEGTDSDGRQGQVVLDAGQWLNIKARKDHDSAVADYDAEVAAFFAPLNAAAEALEATHYKQVDPATVVIIDAGEQHVAGRNAEVVELHSHSVILRLIEEGHSDRLIWVGDNLEVRAFVPEAAPFLGGTGEAPVAEDEPVAPAPVAPSETAATPDSQTTGSFLG